MLAWLLALACGGGQRHPSTLLDTQIIAFVADPPEANPGERVALEITAVDPKRRGLDMMLWSCLLYEGLCVESQVADMDQWAVVQRRTDGFMATSHGVPSQAWDLLDFADPLPTLLIALACPPDTCPIIDEVEARIERGVRAGDELSADLADPSRWMADLPVDGVSLAARVFPVSSANPGDRNENPTIEPRFSAGVWDEEVDPEPLPITLSRGEVLEMPFLVSDPNGETVYVFAYTTLGRFAERYVRSEENAVRHYLIAPDQAGRGQIFLVFEDGDGGAVLWQRRLIIE